MKTETLNKEFVGDGMYREHILDHYQHPRNFGTLNNADLSHKEFNPVCGDNLSFQLTLDSKGKVSDVKFTGSGCAISVASASLLSDELMGKTQSQIEKLGRENVMELLGIELGPVRLKCAMLALDTVKNAFTIHQKYNKEGK
ncbi:MAG: iron-sulfur cluster assembly scaffold protein [archaeon]